LRLTYDGERLTHTQGACKLAEPYFAALSNLPERPVASIEGQPTTLAQAIEQAAEILGKSRAPLIWGLSRSSTAGQKAAVLLAERIGANVDTTASVCHGPSIMAIQQVGESTCSLGEVRNRADLVVFWGADPVRSHPRHFERYSVDAVGEFIPLGRMNRHIVVVDSDETETSHLADSFLKVHADADFDLIWALRHVLRDGQLPTSFDVGVSEEQIHDF